MKHFILGIISAASLAITVNAFATETYKGAPVMKDMPATGGLSVSLGALYLRPSSANLDYAFTEPTQLFRVVALQASPLPTVGSSSTFTTESYNPKYGLGYLLNVGYEFPNTLNDVQVSWMHFNRTSSSDRTSTGTSSSLPIFIDGMPTFEADSIFTDFETIAGNFYTLSSLDSVETEIEATYKLDVVDFDFGQKIMIGKLFNNPVQTRLFAGIRYALIKNEVEINYTGTQLADSFFIGSPLEPLSPFSEFDSSFSKFQGAGPLFGANGSLALGRGFKIVGTFDAALLVGSLEFSQSEHAKERGFDFPDQSPFIEATDNTYHYDSVHRVVPALDGRLGLAYTLPLKQGSEVTAELGYQVSKYFDVLGVGFFNGGSLNLENIGLDGTYLTVSITV